MTSNEHEPLEHKPLAPVRRPQPLNPLRKNYKVRLDRS